MTLYEKIMEIIEKELKKKDPNSFAVTLQALHDMGYSETTMKVMGVLLKAYYADANLLKEQLEIADKELIKAEDLKNEVEYFVENFKTYL